MHNNTSIRPPMNSMPAMNTGAPPPPDEPTTRERIARVKTLAGRASGHWKMSFLLFVIGCGIAIGAAWKQKYSYRSECIVQFKAGLKIGERGEDSPAERALKLAPKLKEQLNTRARLESVIKEYKLYPKIVDSQGMLAAVEEMRDKHVGFRGKDSDSYVISFEDESAEVAQKVAQKLADTMIDEYSRGSLDAVLKQVKILTVEENRSENELVSANRAFATFLSLHPEFAAEMKKNGVGAGIPGAKDPGALMPAKVSHGDRFLDEHQRQRDRIEAEIKALQTGTPLASAMTGTPQQEAKLAKAKRDRDEAAKGIDDANARVASAKASGASDVNPDMVSARRQLEVAKASMAAADNGVREAETDIRLHNNNPFDTPATPANVDGLRRKLADVDAQMAAYRASTSGRPVVAATADAAASEPMSDIVRDEAEFQKLSRNLQQSKSEHDDILHNLELAQAMAAREKNSGGDTMSILDPAYRPLKPAKGGRSKTAMTGGAAALFVALLYAFARVVFNDTMIDAADIESLKLIPVLGVLPKIPPQAHGANSPVAMAKGGAPGAV